MSHRAPLTLSLNLGAGVSLGEPASHWVRGGSSCGQELLWALEHHQRHINKHQPLSCSPGGLGWKRSLAFQEGVTPRDVRLLEPPCWSLIMTLLRGHTCHLHASLARLLNLWKAPAGLSLYICRHRKSIPFSQPKWPFRYKDDFKMAHRKITFQKLW